MASQPIWLKHSTHQGPCTPTLPSCWQGEPGCVVGPFSSKGVAEYFATSNVESRYDAIMENIFPNGDAWYVEVRALES